MQSSRRCFLTLSLAALAVLAPCCFADDDLLPPPLPPPSPSPILPNPPSAENTGVDWTSLLNQSLQFLSLEHGFRYITEQGTRHAHLPFFGGYQNSLGNLHGWADGDPFYVNYVGHPMQGATAGFLFAQNDRAFRRVEFGKNAPYWKSRLRATAFSWAYSEQFEIGPLSEASIGNTQAFFPEQGFVDHVATPAIGLAWMITEDALDKYVIGRLENHTHNRVVWAALRGGLNPTRSLANMLAHRPPWYRETRCGLNHMDCLAPEPLKTSVERTPHPQAAAFEFFATAQSSTSFGPGARGSCVGGDGSVALRVATHLEIAAAVGGCKLTRFGDNFSGDSLTFLAGPRWTPRPEGKWQPFVQILAGGRKLTHEELDPARKAALQASAAQQGRVLSFPDHALYTQDWQSTGAALSAGAGLDLRLAPAIGFRLGEFNYMHSWTSDLNGISYGDTAQFTSGLILRFGTW